MYYGNPRRKREAQKNIFEKDGLKLPNFDDIHEFTHPEAQ